MGFLLTLLGILFLLLALAGIGFGVYMTTNPNTSELGWLFALWWVPAAASASGILMRDLVTFVIGLGCFFIAGIVFLATGVLMRGRRKSRVSNGKERSGPESGLEKTVDNKSRNRPAS